MNLPSLERLSEALRSMSPDDRQLLDKTAETLRDVGAGAAEEYLSSALSSADEDCRLWAAGAAPDVLGIRSVPVLSRALYDQSDDVRSLAMTGIVSMRPEALRPHLPRLITDLGGRNALQVMWLLARLRASDATGTLKDLAASLPVTDPNHKLATLTASLLEGGPRELGVYLSDHEYCSWAAYFLARLGTVEALDTLRAAVTSAGACQAAAEEAAGHLEDFLGSGREGFHDVDGAPYHLRTPITQEQRADVAQRVARLADQMGRPDQRPPE